MVYQADNQLSRYHRKPDQFLTTHSHFFDSASTECPNPERRTGSHKGSTHAKLYQGSLLNKQLSSSGRQDNMAKGSSLGGPNGLFPDPMRKTQPSSTYRGNGSFTVRLVDGDGSLWVVWEQAWGSYLIGTGPGLSVRSHSSHHILRFGSPVQQAANAAGF